MSGPEDNPADDVQPTKEEWEEYERQRTMSTLKPMTAEEWRVFRQHADLAARPVVGDRIALALKERERLARLVECQEQFLVCYRLGKQPTHKLLDEIALLKGADDGPGK